MTANFRLLLSAVVVRVAAPSFGSSSPCLLESTQ
jgi:hypothetical protein